MSANSQLRDLISNVQAPTFTAVEADDGKVPAQQAQALTSKATEEVTQTAESESGANVDDVDVSALIAAVAAEVFQSYEESYERWREGDGESRDIGALRTLAVEDWVRLEAPNPENRIEARLSMREEVNTVVKVRPAKS